MFETQVRAWVTGLEDLSVSRPQSRLTWGIRVPSDPTQTVGILFTFSVKDTYHIHYSPHFPLVSLKGMFQAVRFYT